MKRRGQGGRRAEGQETGGNEIEKNQRKKGRKRERER
jgi:hypothetical protein